MSTVIDFPKPLSDEYLHWGVCPKCKRCDGYLNVGAQHWFHCSLHKLKWTNGSNLFSSWREETEEDWRQNFEMLFSMRKVEPLYPLQEGQGA